MVVKHQKNMIEMQKTKMTTSQKIALGVLGVDTVATFTVLGLCAFSICRGFEGAMPYLTTLIGALQVVTGIVLSAYYKKSTMENCKGGIIYDSAFAAAASEVTIEEREIV